MRGTGRFNVAQGMTVLAVGAGAAVSNLVAGFIVGRFGYSAGFLTLASIAIGALIFFATFMPEVRLQPKAHNAIGRAAIEESS